MADDAGALLVRSGLISEEQLLIARQAQAGRGGVLGEHLVLAGFIADDRLAEFYRVRLMVPQVTPDLLTRLDPTLVELIPAEMATDFRCVPIKLDDDGNLTLAMADPSITHTVDEIAFFTRQYVVRTVATQGQIAWCLATYYQTVTPLGEKLAAQPDSHSLLPDGMPGLDGLRRADSAPAASGPATGPGIGPALGAGPGAGAPASGPRKPPSITSQVDASRHRVRPPVTSPVPVGHSTPGLPVAPMQSGTTERMVAQDPQAIAEGAKSVQSGPVPVAIEPEPSPPRSKPFVRSRRNQRVISFLNEETSPTGPMRTLEREKGVQHPELFDRAGEVEVATGPIEIPIGDSDLPSIVISTDSEPILLARLRPPEERPLPLPGEEPPPEVAPVAPAADPGAASRAENGDRAASAAGLGGERATSADPTPTEPAAEPSPPQRRRTERMASQIPDEALLASSGLASPVQADDPASPVQSDDPASPVRAGGEPAVETGDGRPASQPPERAGDPGDHPGAGQAVVARPDAAEADAGDQGASEAARRHGGSGEPGGGVVLLDQPKGKSAPTRRRSKRTQIGLGITPSLLTQLVPDTRRLTADGEEPFIELTTKDEKRARERDLVREGDGPALPRAATGELASDGAEGDVGDGGEDGREHDDPVGKLRTRRPARDTEPNDMGDGPGSFDFSDPDDSDDLGHFDPDDFDAAATRVSDAAATVASDAAAARASDAAATVASDAAAPGAGESETTEPDITSALEAASRAMHGGEDGERSSRDDFTPRKTRRMHTADPVAAEPATTGPDSAQAAAQRAQSEPRRATLLMHAAEPGSEPDIPKGSAPADPEAKEPDTWPDIKPETRSEPETRRDGDIDIEPETLPDITRGAVVHGAAKAGSGATGKRTGRRSEPSGGGVVVHETRDQPTIQMLGAPTPYPSDWRGLDAADSIIQAAEAAAEAHARRSPESGRNAIPMPIMDEPPPAEEFDEEDPTGQFQREQLTGGDSFDSEADDGWGPPGSTIPPPFLGATTAIEDADSGPSQIPIFTDHLTNENAIDLQVSTSSEPAIPVPGDAADSDAAARAGDAGSDSSSPAPSHIPRDGSDAGVEADVMTPETVRQLEESALGLVAILRHLDQAGTRDRVVGILTDHLVQSYRRVAFFAVKSGRLSIWKKRIAGEAANPESDRMMDSNDGEFGSLIMGEDQDFGPDVEDITLTLNQPSTFQDIVGTRLPYRGPLDDPMARGFIEQTFGSPAPRMLGLPVAVRGRVVGVLYGDHRYMRVFREHLAVVTRAAGVAFERILKNKKNG